MISSTLFACLCLALIHGGESLEHKHHNRTELETYLMHMKSTYPNMTKLYSIGQSLRGYDIWVLAIGKDINEYMELRPSVKYVGNIHGNEVLGRELLLHLIDLLLTGYGTNTTITELLDTTAIHILPSMNPDGYEDSQEGDCSGVQGRYNENGKDLNRNFPDLLFDNADKPVQKESQNIIDWLPQYNFVLSANFHGGALVANYPMDQYLNQTVASGPSPSPDDDFFRHICLVYARSHHTMAATNGACEGENDFFQDGITNGADWYPIAGGMQDYNYLAEGIPEVTLEVSCCKYPLTMDLNSHWIKNKDALVNFLLLAHMGVKGLLTDKNNNMLVGAELHIVGRELATFKSHSHGDFYRLLMPGTYTLEVRADGYETMRKQFTVEDGTVTRLDLTMEFSIPSGGARNTFGLHLLSLLMFLSFVFLQM